MLPISGAVGSVMALATVAKPLRREMPPVARTSKFSRREQERGYTSMSERRDIAGEISPPLNANRFIVVYCVL